MIEAKDTLRMMKTRKARKPNEIFELMFESAWVTWVYHG